MERKTVKIVVFNRDDLNYNLPEKPDEFMSWWQEKLDMVPEEHRATATVELEANVFYDSSELEATVSYTRPESDDELAARKLKEKQQREFRENQELCELERLKKKFGV